MNEKELGRMLLGLDAANLAGVPDAKQQTWRALERDRRRVWWVTAMTLLTWLLGVGLVIWVLAAAWFLIPKHAQLMLHIQQGKIDAATRDHVAAFHQKLTIMMALGTAGSVVVLALAALCTLLLIRVSRQATLRQVNASLLTISEQLRQQRPGP